MDLDKQIRSYVTCVVFYSADSLDLLPAIRYPYNRGNVLHDEQKSIEENTVLDEREKHVVTCLGAFKILKMQECIFFYSRYILDPCTKEHASNSYQGTPFLNGGFVITGHAHG